MLGFVVRRCLSAVLVLFITSMIVFVIFFKGPTSPAQTICDRNGTCTQAELERIEQSMGLNDSLTTAYGKFIDGVFTGRKVEFSPAEVYDCPAPCFGVSFNTREVVTDGLKERYPATLSLALGGAFLYLVLGVFVGVMAARFRGTLADRALVTGALFVSAVPYYLVALLAWIYFTQKTAIFPNTEGYNPFFENPAAWFGGMLLPWLVLALATAPAYSRYSRGQMVETMGEDYMRTAVAKGQTRNKVVFRHGLRAAIVPVVTIFGLDFGALLAGTVFTEKIFGIDGMGAWAIDSLRGADDIPVVLATALIGAFFIIMSNLVVDLLYGVLDPRVKVV